MKTLIKTSLILSKVASLALRDVAAISGFRTQYKSQGFSILPQLPVFVEHFGFVRVFLLFRMTIEAA